MYNSDQLHRIQGDADFEVQLPAFLLEGSVYASPDGARSMACRSTLCYILPPSAEQPGNDAAAAPATVGPRPNPFSVYACLAHMTLSGSGPVSRTGLIGRMICGASLRGFLTICRARRRVRGSAAPFRTKLRVAMSDAEACPVGDTPPGFALGASFLLQIGHTYGTSCLHFISVARHRAAPPGYIQSLLGSCLLPTSWHHARTSH